MTSGTPSDAPPRVATTAMSRLRPPAVPSPFLRRERLLERLGEALERRLTTGRGGRRLRQVDASRSVGGGGQLRLVQRLPRGCVARAVLPRHRETRSACASRASPPARRARSSRPARVPGSTSPGGRAGSRPRSARRFRRSCTATSSSSSTTCTSFLRDAPSARFLEKSALCRQAPAQLHLVLAYRSARCRSCAIQRLRGEGLVTEHRAAAARLQRRRDRRAPADRHRGELLYPSSAVSLR